jgi:hypothetical protein
VLDEESQLLQVAARTPAAQSTRLHDAYAALVEGLHAELADWLHGWAPELSATTAMNIAVVGIDALIGRRTTGILFHTPANQTPDEQYLTEWTTLLALRIREANAEIDGAEP